MSGNEAVPDISISIRQITVGDGALISTFYCDRFEREVKGPEICYSGSAYFTTPITGPQPFTFSAGGMPRFNAPTQ